MADAARKTKRASADWRRYYRAALEAIESESYEQALEHFQDAIAFAPEEWQPHYGRAWLFLNNYVPESPDASVVDEDLRAALKYGGDACPDAAIQLGRRLAKERKHDEAFRLILRGCARSSHPECEEALIEALANCLEEIEREGPVAVQRCVDLEAYVATASLPRSMSNALLGEIVASRAALTQDKPQRLLQWQRLQGLAPAHPRLPADLDTQLASGLGSTNTEQSLPTFAQLAGHTRKDSFQAELVAIFETYFNEEDLSVLRTRLRAFGQPPTRTLLMFGPSGSGKTYAVRSFAGEYQRRFRRPMPILPLRLDKVMDKWVGETEKIITAIFDQAIRTQPCIIFADEVDALGSSRDRGQDWKVSQTTHLLQEIDRLCRAEAVVLFFGCTNRLAAIDPAMMRRFDRTISADLPESEVRREMFDLRLQSLGADAQPVDANLDALARASHGMAPGDIDKAIRRAADRVMSESVQSGIARPLSQADLLQAIAEFSHPEHVQRWLQEATEAFRRVGQMDRADALQVKYKRFVGNVAIESGTGGFDRVPDTEWFSEQTYDFS